MSKAIAEAERWVSENRLDGEVWRVEAEAYVYA
jgi:hypothetical protein